MRRGSQIAISADPTRSYYLIQIVNQLISTFSCQYKAVKIYVKWFYLDGHLCLVHPTRKETVWRNNWNPLLISCPPYTLPSISGSAIKIILILGLKKPHRICEKCCLHVCNAYAFLCLHTIKYLMLLCVHLLTLFLLPRCPGSLL